MADRPVPESMPCPHGGAGRRPPGVWLPTIAIVVVVAVVVAVVIWQRSPLLSDDFSGPDALLTNEFAYVNQTDSRSVMSPRWWVTSGTLFRTDNTGWTGPIDQVAPGPTSLAGSDSRVFRMVSREQFSDIVLSLRLRIDARTRTGSTKTSDWDGVHLFLRYRDEFSLYVVSVGRRDGRLVIKKKLPGGPSNGGTYYPLAQAGRGILDSGWHDVVAEVRDVPGGVNLTLTIDGKQVLTARDPGTGGPALTGAGSVGLRGDETEFHVDDIVVNRA